MYDIEPAAIYHGCEHCGYTTRVDPDLKPGTCPECSRNLEKLSSHAAADLRRERFEAERNRVKSSRVRTISRAAD